MYLELLLVRPSPKSELLLEIVEANNFKGHVAQPTSSVEKHWRLVVLSA